MGPHAPFILASYAIVVVAVGGLLAWLIIQGMETERRIRDLEAKGVRRRSDGTPSAEGHS